MKSIFKRVFFISVVTLIVIGMFAIKRYRLGGFKLSKIMQVSNNLEPIKDPINLELNDILSNSFYYLGKGTQFYAFVSLDQKYVIKILRKDRLTVHLRKRIFPAYVIRENNKNKNRKRRFLKACKISYNNLKDQTGVIYLHLESSVNLTPIDIIDKFGLHKKIDLNNFCFLIQKKAVLVKEAFKNLKKQDNLSVAKTQISSFLNLIKIRTLKGVSNTDPNVFKNFGFIENQALEIDFGDFYENSNLLKNEQTYISEINKYSLILRDWLVNFWPETIPYFDEQHNSILKNEKIFN